VVITEKRERPTVPDDYRHTGIVVITIK